METYEINTNLDNFLLIDEIIDINDSLIIAKKKFEKPSYFLILEFFAQVASFHTRYLISFKKHSFLLKFKCFELNEKAQSEKIIKANLIGKSSNAYSYFLEIDDEAKAEILIGTIDYDEEFKEEILKKYYQERFQCLTKNLKKKS